MATNAARKMIIDTDVGLDDASAIFLATKARTKGLVDILAITAVHGNTKVENVLCNIGKTLMSHSDSKLHTVCNNTLPSLSQFLSLVPVCSGHSNLQGSQHFVGETAHFP